MKTQNFCTSKETITKVKGSILIGRKSLSRDSTNRGLIIQIYKELKTLNIKRTNTTKIKWANELNTQFSEEEQMAIEYMRKNFNLLSNEKRHINTILRSISPQSQWQL
jgi:hypothetical protein